MSAYTIPHVISRDGRGERVMDVYSQLLAERIIYLGTGIDSGVANAIIAQLLHLESADPQVPVNLYINCEGGDPSATLAIYDTMQYIRAPVATTCVGQAFAAGAVLLAGGEPGMRSMLPHTRIVLHQPAIGAGRGAIPDLILHADELVRVRGEIERVLARHTGRGPDQLRRDTDRDRVFAAAEALDYGLVDEVLSTRPTTAASPAAG
ncbi:MULTISPECIES: ClpP family protease [unclassified Nesterenkonia]|uniref:ClpP family protease n=1 Tax=unclassified Nesterenkonia TaxID=2629769 RepID=UPI000872D8A1|nr:MULTISPECIES: ATP-dependent Clp protease proteolytic subunit [unclassified Nesterenkonia]MDS2173871.1 ATP-dependent Clp protease proteolytic subunit [Nesterenkonia sp. CL21]OSM43397.1 ATP-dependent Clp protease proteolytic subunit [Nesterenkonia sp. PF2B19]